LFVFKDFKLIGALALLRHFFLSIRRDLCSIDERDARTRREVGAATGTLERSVRRGLAAQEPEKMGSNLLAGSTFAGGA
jgi:hypothetical protein